MNEENRHFQMEKIARAALSRWGIDQKAELRLISFSENAIFLVTSSGQKWVMRVHRAGYHSLDGVRSELAWMKALREDANVETPIALPGEDNELIQFVEADPASGPRMVVLFQFIDGSAPQGDDLCNAFRQLGSITARMHHHAREWKRPVYFQRQVWDYEGAFGQQPIWGHWRHGFCAEKDGLEIVERADRLMFERLTRFGKGAKRFGLIHTDFRLSNLLVSHGRTRVLDFDDSGFGWYLYDIASSVTFLENHGNIGDIISSWIEGYRTVGELCHDDIAEIPTLMMFRRLIIMGWAGSHPHTGLAREMGTQYTVDTVELAQKYLSEALCATL